MAMSKCVSFGSILVGCSLLMLTFISVICGGVFLSKAKGPNSAYASVRLWGLYFAIPGVFSIIAGYKQISSMLIAALPTHIAGIAFAIAGFITELLYWIYFDNLDTSEDFRDVAGLVTIIFALFAILTLIGSIYGCTGACTAGHRQQERTGIVTTTQPAIVILPPLAYPASYDQPPPPYDQGHE